MTLKSSFRFMWYVKRNFWLTEINVILLIETLYDDKKVQYKTVWRNRQTRQPQKLIRVSFMGSSPITGQRGGGVIGSSLGSCPTGSCSSQLLPKNLMLFLLIVNGIISFSYRDVVGRFQLSLRKMQLRGRIFVLETNGKSRVSSS